MIPHIVVDPEAWALANNIEYVYCTVPDPRDLNDLDDVWDGVHSVIAVGYDMVGARLTIDTASAMAAPPDLRDFTQMSFLSRAIYALRREETLASPEFE